MKTYQELFEVKIPNNKIIVAKDEDQIAGCIIPQPIIAKVLAQDGDLLQGWDDEFDDVKEYAKEMQKATPRAKKFASMYEYEYVKDPVKGLALPIYQADMDMRDVKGGHLADMLGVKKNDIHVIDVEDL